MSTSWHNPPTPFNPEYIPYAKDVSTVAAYKTALLKLATKEERAVAWRKFYDEQMKVGAPTKAEIMHATEYLYNED